MQLDLFLNGLKRKKKLLKNDQERLNEKKQTAESILLISFHGSVCSRYPKEVVEGEDVEVSLILHVQKFKDVL